MGSFQNMSLCYPAMRVGVSNWLVSCPDTGEDRISDRESQIYFLSSNSVRGAVEDALCDPRGGDWPGPLWLERRAVWRRPEKTGKQRERE